MKKLIVYLTIFSLLFTSCATFVKVAPYSSRGILNEIERTSKNKRTTIELMNGKFYHTQNLEFTKDFLTFIATDSTKTEKVKLEEIHRIVIEKEEIKNNHTFTSWLIGGGLLSGILGYFGAMSAKGSLFDPTGVFTFIFVSGMTITVVGGLIHVLVEKSNNRIIYNFSPKAIK